MPTRLAFEDGDGCWMLAVGVRKISEGPVTAAFAADEVDWIEREKPDLFDRGRSITAFAEERILDTEMVSDDHGFVNRRLRVAMGIPSFCVLWLLLLAVVKTESLEDKIRSATAVVL